MDWMILGTFLAFNVGISFLMHLWQARALERRLRQVRQEIEEMEDLVSAIIAELEEAADFQPTPTVEIPEEAVIFNEGMPAADFPELSQAQAVVDDTAVAELEAIDFSEREEMEEAVVTEIATALPISPAQPEAVKTRVLAPKYEQILELHRQGVEVEEIAKQLGLGRGEVQLILGLYQRS